MRKQNITYSQYIHNKTNNIISILIQAYLNEKKQSKSVNLAQ